MQPDPPFTMERKGRLEESIEGVPVIFVGREDLIRIKEACGRHIDLHDAEQLRKHGQAGG